MALRSALPGPACSRRKLRLANTPRERLWLALSALFLDTETRWYLPYAARVAVEEGFSWEEVRYALDYELSPVLGPNLLDIAGEWAGFEESWLLGQLREVAARPAGWRDKLQAQVTGVLNGRLYQALSDLHSYLRAIAPEELTAEASRLSSLAKFCLEPKWSRAQGFWSWTRLLSPFSLEEVERSFLEGIRPVYTPLLGHEGDATVIQLGENWRDFRAFFSWLKSQPEPSKKLLSGCEELAYLYTVPRLTQVPRGPMVLERLGELGVSDSEVQALLSGPLSGLYGVSEEALLVWKELRALRP